MSAATHCHGCGEALPPAKKYAHRRKWCSERCRKQTLYSTACVDCGGRTTGDGSYHLRCQRCNGIATAARQREEWAPVKRLIEQMWADGMTATQIGHALGGSGPINQSSLRSRGYDLPHRRTPEQIARICADGGANLAKARAVKLAEVAA